MSMSPDDRLWHLDYLESVSLLFALRDMELEPGCVAITQELVASGMWLLSRLYEAGYSSPDSISPSPEGTILFAWETEDGLMEAELEHPDKLMWLDGYLRVNEQPHTYKML